MFVLESKTRHCRERRLGRRDQIPVLLYACTYMLIFGYVCVCVCAATISVLSIVSQEISFTCVKGCVCADTIGEHYIRAQTFRAG